MSSVGGFAVAAVATLVACAGSPRADGFLVVRRLPHDPGAYTQGLVLADGQLFESTGRLGYSQVRRIDPESGSVLASVALPDDRFGEGITLLAGRLYQLTWKAEIGYIYDASSLALVDSFRYEGEGWGLATDGRVLIKSDGTSRLQFLDPAGFGVVREVTVTDGGAELGALNELEWVAGSLYANVYQSDWIVKVDPESGAVLEWYNMGGLLSRRERTALVDVLNGIGYDERTGRFLVTGKLWPYMFEVEFREADEVR